MLPVMLRIWLALTLLLAVWPVEARDRVAGLAAARDRLTAELLSEGLSLGAAVFLRIFKETEELEVWLQASDGWQLFRTYPICRYSGGLGPKLREGDMRTPEGLYRVRADQLNPYSNFHLAFNLGFPNAYDRANGRTGSYLMVHGSCASIGCYAMTDTGIEEIYALVEAALNGGQSRFWVHAFPARLSEAWLQAQHESPWHTFWQDLKVCHDIFETRGEVPAVSVRDALYVCR